MAMNTIQLKTHYEAAETLCLDPVVAIKELVISAVECEYLINKAKPLIKRAGVVLDSGYDTVEGRSGSNCWLSFEDDEVVAAIGQRIADIVGLPLMTSESLQVIHYGVGQEYRPHFDAFELHTPKGMRASKWGGQRLVTALVYLNDVENGGGTSFPRLDLEVAAERGRLVIFHNVKERIDKPHPSSLHGGMPVLTGEKWAFNMWFRHQPTHKEFSERSLKLLPEVMFEHMTGAGVGRKVERGLDRVATDQAAKQSSMKTPVNLAAGVSNIGRQSTCYQVVSNRSAELWDQAAARLNLASSSTDKCTRIVYWDTYGGAKLPEYPRDDNVTREFCLVDRAHMKLLGDIECFAQRMGEFGLGDLVVPSLRIGEGLRSLDTESCEWILRRRASFADQAIEHLAQEDIDRLLAAELDKPSGSVVQCYPPDAFSDGGASIKVRLHLVVGRGRLLLFDQVLTANECLQGSKNLGISHRKRAVISQVKLLQKSVELIRGIFPVLADLVVECSDDKYAVLAIDAVVSNFHGLKIVNINSCPNLSYGKPIDEQVMVPLLDSTMEFLAAGNHSPRGFISGCFV